MADVSSAILFQVKGWARWLKPSFTCPAFHTREDLAPNGTRIRPRDANNPRRQPAVGSRPRETVR